MESFEQTVSADNLTSPSPSSDLSSEGNPNLAAETVASSVLGQVIQSCLSIIFLSHWKKSLFWLAAENCGFDADHGSEKKNLNISGKR